MLGSKLLLRLSIIKGTQKKKKFILAFLLNFEYSRRRFGIFTRHFAKQTRKEKKSFFLFSFVFAYYCAVEISTADN